MNELRPHEWVSVALFLLVMCFLTKIAWNAPSDRWPKRNREPVPVPREQIVVTISGAVAKEGRYHFVKGTTLGQALEAAQLSEDADMQKLTLDRELKSRQKIRIPRKKQNKH
jgi:hypothetical protein